VDDGVPTSIPYLNEESKKSMTIDYKRRTTVAAK
jgi:hypothetical protein